MLYGRTTHEMMEGYWPAVARDAKAPRAEREWARTLTSADLETSRDPDNRSG
jgi:hypothetical protein